MLPNNGDSNFQTDMYQNILNMGPAYAMYSSTFGNPNFVVQPATPGAVQGGFPTIPYIGIEAALWAGTASNPLVAPANVQTGSTSGTQNLSGTLTLTNSNGVVQGAIGNVSNASQSSAPLTNTTASGTSATQ